MTFLQGLVQGSGQGVPRPLKQIDPDFGAGMIPEMGNPVSVPTTMPAPNIIQQLLAQDQSVAPQGFAPIDVGAPDLAQNSRPRRSVLDIIGGLSDVVADVGGAKPMYQSGLDAQTERERASMDYDWREKFNTQKLTRGDQEIEGGGLELDNAQSARMGQAARGLNSVFEKYGAPGVQKAWPIIAQQLGIPADKQAIFAEQLTTDPEATLTALNSALNPAPAQGSLPKEVQVYEMLLGKDPKLAAEYLATVATGDKGISEYQRAQLERTDRNFNYRRGNDYRNFQFKENQAATKAGGTKTKGDPVAAATSAQGVINEMRDAFNRLKQAGGINAKGQSVAGRAGAWAMENVPLAERATNPDSFSARQDLDRLRTQGITSLLPLLGGLQLGGKNIDAAKELDTWRKAIASASDYESAMRALDGFQNRINQIVNGASTPAGPKAPNSSRKAPAPRRKPAGGSGAPSVSNW